MCTNTCTYAYICTHSNMHRYLFTYMYICIWAHVYVHVCTYAWTHKCTHILACTCICKLVYMSVYVCSRYMHVYIYTLVVIYKEWEYADRQACKDVGDWWSVILFMEVNWWQWPWCSSAGGGAQLVQGSYIQVVSSKWFEIYQESISLVTTKGLIGRFCGWIDDYGGAL